MDNHTAALLSLCRICGNSVKSSKNKEHIKLCNKYSADILTVFGIDLSRDSSCSHPQHFCVYCYRRMINTKRRNNSTSYIVNDISHVEQIWKPHVDNCPVCSQAQEAAKGCLTFRKRKCDAIRFERIPLQYNSEMNDIFFSDVHSTLPIESRDLRNFDIAYFDTPVVDTFICKLCSNIFDICSVKTACDHYFCSTCLSLVFKKAHKNNVDCPICFRNVDYQDIKKVDDRFKVQLLALRVRCVKCKHIQRLSNVHEHKCRAVENESTHDMDITFRFINTKTPSTRDSVKPVGSSRPTSINSCLKRSTKSPLSNIEEKLHTQLTRRKLQFSTDKATIKCTTGGQVRLFY